MSGQIRVLVVDDDALVRAGLSMLLAGAEDIEIVGEAADGSQVAQAAAEHRPDVVLMDIVFKGPMNGIEATRKIKELSPATKVVIMTAHDDERLLVDAVEAGASGFLGKDEAADEVLGAARAAAEGEVLIDPTTLTRLLHQVAREREEQRDAQILLDQLTEREKEILHLLAQGERNDDIAAKLFISPQTVQTHVRNLLGKLRVHSKLEAVAFAVKHGAITV
jgi:DNA-binding NarL/FixJ family response regulator